MSSASELASSSSASESASNYQPGKGFARRTNPDGTKNAKYIDVLDRDAVIPAQKYVCVSFLSPEKELKAREQFFFSEFVKQWDFSHSVQKFGDFLQFLSHKYRIEINDMMADYRDFVDAEKEELKQYSCEDDYKTFLEKMEDVLQQRFDEQNEFRTSVRGFKVRGSYSSQKEAEKRAKKLRETDPYHDILVGLVGAWMPWDPEAYRVGNVQYMEEELNQLYQEKIKNAQKAKDHFDHRVKEAKRRAIEENVRKARATGNTLTQSIREDGTLVGVKETVNFDEREVAPLNESAPKPVVTPVENNNTSLPTENHDSASSSSAATATATEPQQQQP